MLRHKRKKGDAESRAPVRESVAPCGAARLTENSPKTYRYRLLPEPKQPANFVSVNRTVVEPVREV